MHEADDLSETAIAILYLAFLMYPKYRVQNIFFKTLASSITFWLTAGLVLCCILPCVVYRQI